MKNTTSDSFKDIHDDFSDLWERMEDLLVEEFSDDASSLVQRYKRYRNETGTQDPLLARHMAHALYFWTDKQDLLSGELRSE